jgi:hypothetical protein
LHCPCHPPRNHLRSFILPGKKTLLEHFWLGKCWTHDDLLTSLVDLGVEAFDGLVVCLAALDTALKIIWRPYGLGKVGLHLGQGRGATI